MSDFEKWYDIYERDGGELMLFNTIDLEAAWQAATKRAAEVARKVSEELLWAANTEMEGYSYFGSNKGVPQDEFEDISIKIAAAIEGDT
jgi:hypothetical protein